jgi:hypothetical protein
MSASKNSTKQTKRAGEMRRTYDSSGGVRGKYARAMQAGYAIRIHAPDGTIQEKQVPSHSLVSLEPDVQAYFPDSDAVNHALRTLIKLVPEKRRRARTERGRTAARRGASKRQQQGLG